jgi:hypothetical protein
VKEASALDAADVGITLVFFVVATAFIVARDRLNGVHAPVRRVGDLPWRGRRAAQHAGVSRSPPQTDSRPRAR